MDNGNRSTSEQKVAWSVCTLYSQVSLVSTQPGYWEKDWDGMQEGKGCNNKDKKARG